MRKKIIEISAVIAFLAMLCTQSAAAYVSGVTVNIWTDKTQYKPGEKGILKISVLNNRDDSIEIRNITIQYPWFAYDAKEGKWVGNETLKLDPYESLSSHGGHYYKEVEFTIPTDGRVAQYLGVGGSIYINIGTDKGTEPKSITLYIASVSLPMSVAGLDTWTTSLTAVIVVCTIILAAVVFLATRRGRTPITATSSPLQRKAKAE